MCSFLGHPVYTLRIFTDEKIIIEHPQCVYTVYQKTEPLLSRKILSLFYVTRKSQDIALRWQKATW